MSENDTKDNSTEEKKTFVPIMKDFLGDILNTFPEYQTDLDKGLSDILLNKTESLLIDKLKEYCKTIYPERFFDLLYQNEKIFENPEINTCFLPNIDFKELWKQEISDKTKKIIWKYLQLICFSIINTEDNVNGFGDTAKLFEAIGENQLKEKLHETISQMNSLFGENAGDVVNGMMDCSNNLPNPEKLHEHINGLMEGKLGRLASEITEETLHEFTDMSGATSVNDVFQKLFQNPGKLMGLIKKLGSSLDEKIKSGEIKESELMEEAASIMEKMQNVPGMKNMKGLLEKMGLSGLGGNGKIDLNAMRNAMGGNIRKTKMKERMKEKLKARQAKKGEDKDAQIRILQQQLSNAKKITENLQNLGSTELSKKSKKKRKKKKKRNKARNKK
tara:strand:+ start:665 stop:1831 length:1167 start_codon:yes stop_codon:yes gene_type:complete